MNPERRSGEGMEGDDRRDDTTAPQRLLASGGQWHAGTHHTISCFLGLASQTNYNNNITLITNSLQKYSQVAIFEYMRRI